MLEFLETEVRSSKPEGTNVVGIGRMCGGNGRASTKMRQAPGKGLDKVQWGVSPGGSTE